MAEEKADGIEINVQDIEVGPSECPVDSPLDLKIVFTANAPISNASWTVQVSVSPQTTDILTWHVKNTLDSTWWIQ